ncbi:Zinc finger MYM-type protein [Echinococcus granulosus]|uniref:Zinc finger MYM-type protein n=1 Tax=Echinococcus granulosus TaxID=6210 RepID=W6UNQ0_ECHGR|nr:Zinc finger MYM-type protein [Echinococcus granulosus]EUB54979.1 Zinc finger MYM-type protein [Echinococcus granulosus]
MAVYGQNMTAIDPESCQLVEVPIDANGAIVVQDPSALISGGQVQVGGIVQTGKSILKPELAQHLIQPVGIRNRLAGRFGLPLAFFKSVLSFQSVIDPRVPQSAQRGARTPARKALGSSQGLQVLQGAQLIQQPSVIAPAASGLLSLGTRYTPSSGIPLSVATGAGGSGGIINSQGNIFTSGGTAMVTTAGTGVDRDAGYRFTAITGTSNRGRPRGRRPLRGQFPVVPIDMVRQLGIEQQVILQPAAPVAMRNKAVLCRPLSVSRKTQSGIHSRDIECQFSAEEEALASKHDEDVEEDEMMVVEESAAPAKKEGDEDADLVEEEEEEEVFSDKNDSDMEGGGTSKQAIRKSEVGANTEAPSTCHFGIQTDEPSKGIKDEQQLEEGTGGKVKLEEKEVKYVPIPVPVPIYVPVPVFAYTRPVPFTLPFPLPCVVPLPLLLKGDEVSGGAVDSAPATTPAPMKQKPDPDANTTTFGSGQMGTEGTTSKTLSQKRSAKESSNSSVDVASPTSGQQGLPSKRLRRTTETPATALGPVAVAATTVMTRRPPMSDASYHLKFSYGINAWRLWVNHTSQPKALADLVDVPDDELNIALTRFVHEVRKPNNETYVADSIFYLCLGIQEYLNENGRAINLFGEPRFASFANALDTVLADFRPRISPEGMLICRIEEEHMWEARQLGDETPHILLFTLLYFITKHMWLRTGDQHAQLRFSNFKLKRENPSSECVLFVSSGSSDSYRMFSTGEQFSRCPIQLFRNYLKKCPQALVAGGGSFYLSPLPEPSLTTWFSETRVPASQLQVMLNRIKMVKEIQEAFMDSQSE